jgi:hypothetical protein
MSRTALLTALLVAALPAALHADEITDQLDAARGFYEKGEYAKALEELEFTMNQLRQLQGKQISQALPEPPDGWTADPADSQTAGAGFMGGGTTITRTYRKASGEQVTIAMVTNSPMLQGMMMMFSNPMFMGADGGELVRIKGQKGVLKFDPAGRSGDLNLVVAQKALVTLEGSNLKDAEPLKELARAIDFDRMAELLNL